MSKRFERWAGNVDAWVIGAALVILAVAYVISKLRGG
jgi:hypothetical protein